MSGAGVQEPEKELRFTRSGQAPAFWLLAAVLAMAGITLLAVSFYRHENPALPHGAWSIPPLLLAAGMARLAVHLTRHAYLILTPLGIEIFPFFRPAKGMHMILWQEIDGAETDENHTRLTLHHNAEKTSGLHLTLRPVERGRRSMIARAVTGRLAERNGR